MPAFRYTALTAGGDTLRGVMDAPDEAAVVARLQRQGSIPVRAEPDTGRGGGLLGALSGSVGGAPALRAAERANITRELSIMLGAGQDLDRALRFLDETAPNTRVRAVVRALRDAVRDGSPLARALSLHPRSFPKLYVGLVRAGEAGGTLAPTLEHLAELLDRQRGLSAAIQSAMVYPAMLLLAATGSIVFLLTSVLPQFVPLFEQNGAKLPATTQFLIDAGAAVADYGLLGLLLLVLAGVAASLALRRPAIRLPVDRALLRLPVVGPLAREVQAARFSRTLGTLLTNGVALIAALAIVRDALGNHAAVAAVDQATISARDGAGLARPLGAANVFPSRTIHLLRLGEENARLGPMALRAAAIHEERVRVGVQRLVSLLTPAIIVLMGGAVAFIISSLLLAMLGLNDLAQ